MGDLKEEVAELDKEFETAFREELDSLGGTIEKSSGDAEEAKQTARCVLHPSTVNCSLPTAT